jgi:hypothetical protein
MSLKMNVLTRRCEVKCKFSVVFGTEFGPMFVFSIFILPYIVLTLLMYAVVAVSASGYQTLNTQLGCSSLC